MPRVLLETSMADSPKFLDGPELAFSLYVKAMLYSARALTDGFVPRSKVYTLVKASRQQVDKAVAHLSAVQPGCTNPSWETRSDGWQIHDYGDPEYMNPMRAEVQELTQKRRIAAQKGGLMSVKKRMEKYGSAQPVKTGQADALPNSTPEANVEAPAEPRASRRAEPHASGFGSAANDAAPKQTSKHPSRSQPNLPSPPSVASQPDTVSGDRALSSEEHGDNAALVANGQPSLAVQVQHLKGWLFGKRGWSNVARDTHLREEAIAKQIVELRLPPDVLYAKLDAWWSETDPDDRPSSLGYFWTRLQDEQHNALKQQSGSHARTEALTKLAPKLRGAKG